MRGNKSKAFQDGKRVAYSNGKSGSDTIHIVAEPDPDQEDSEESVYSWSACSMGGKSTGRKYLLEEDELDDDYLMRNGKVVGKLCGNCRRKL